MLVFAIILFSLSGIVLLLGILNFFQIGFLFNNAYIYASKEEREKLNKKPYYIQTGIVFVLLSILCALEGFYVLYKNIVFFILILVLVFILIVFAIASTIVIEKNKK